MPIYQQLTDLFKKIPGGTLSAGGFDLTINLFETERTPRYATFGAVLAAAAAAFAAAA